MKHIELFESFSKKKKINKGADTDNYDAPEYVIKPAKNDTGFFMLKKEFDKAKTKFVPRAKWKFAD